MNLLRRGGGGGGTHKLEIRGGQNLGQQGRLEGGGGGGGGQGPSTPQPPLNPALCVCWC